jgi:hypothetical protein
MSLGRVFIVQNIIQTQSINYTYERKMKNIHKKNIYKIKNFYYKFIRFMINTLLGYYHFFRKRQYYNGVQ